MRTSGYSLHHSFLDLHVFHVWIVLFPNHHSLQFIYDIFANNLTLYTALVCHHMVSGLHFYISSQMPTHNWLWFLSFSMISWGQEIEFLFTGKWIGWIGVRSSLLLQPGTQEWGGSYGMHCCREDRFCRKECRERKRGSLSLSSSCLQTCEGEIQREMKTILQVQWTYQVISTVLGDVRKCEHSTEENFTQTILPPCIFFINHTYVHTHTHHSSIIPENNKSLEEKWEWTHEDKW